MLKFKCKYTDTEADCTEHFHFEVPEHENPTLRAKEILQDREVDYRNIILKMEI